MSDKEYSFEEERRQGRGHRGPHDLSLSLDEEDDDIGAPSSPVHERSNEEEEGEAHSTEEVAANDVAGPQLSKETVKTAMKGQEGR